MNVEQHDKTLMMDLLESIRLAINKDRRTLTNAQIVVVLSMVLEDFSYLAYEEIGCIHEELNDFRRGQRDD